MEPDKCFARPAIGKQHHKPLLRNYGEENVPAWGNIEGKQFTDIDDAQRRRGLFRQWGRKSIRLTHISATSGSLGKLGGSYGGLDKFDKPLTVPSLPDGIGSVPSLRNSFWGDDNSRRFGPGSACRLRHG